MDKSLEEFNREFAVEIGASDLQDVRVAEFLRLLRLAHNKALLAERTQEIGYQYRQADGLACEGRSAPPKALGSLSIFWLLQSRHRLHNAFERLFPLRWSRSISSRLYSMRAILHLVSLFSRS
jgi:hypothetical protein